MFSSQRIRGLLNRLLMVVVLAVPSLAHATLVRLDTTQGPIDIILYDKAVPRTVANFLNYVVTNSYGNSIIHRSASGLAIQGGGYFWDDRRNTYDTVATNAPIANEFSPLRSNKRGTIAMAKTDGNPDSATSQWFINLSDNGSVYDSFNGGYTVFGEVTASSLAVADAIGNLPVINAGGPFTQLPVRSMPSGSVIAKSNLVIVNTASKSPNSYQGLWWNPNESGWGMSVTQHDDILFAALYTYDDAGRPTWYVIPNCPLTITNGPVTVTSCTGDMYKVNGATPPTVPWNGAGKVTTKVGTGTLTYPKLTDGTLSFTINGQSGSKAITQQIFASGTTPPPIDYTDLWWNPNESGWGISLTQQYNIIFAAWYTYDNFGNPIWYVVANCPVVNGNLCSGTLYQVNGGEALYRAWNGTDSTLAVGSVSFYFADPANATMTYDINSVQSSRSITRQVF
ncbi:MAG: peptidylprolyl isomerase [Betaproteobacteria bacterium]